MASFIITQKPSVGLVTWRVASAPAALMPLMIGWASTWKNFSTKAKATIIATRKATAALRRRMRSSCRCSKSDIRLSSSSPSAALSCDSPSPFWVGGSAGRSSPGGSLFSSVLTGG
jgi:hypothetical protein